PIRINTLMKNIKNWNKVKRHIQCIFLLFILFEGNGQNLEFKEVEIKAVGGLQYDVVRFQVEPGEQVRLILQNTDDMDHNLLITAPGRRESVVEAAFQLADRGPEREFIPDSEWVLESMGVVSPGEEAVLEFTAP